MIKLKDLLTEGKPRAGDYVKVVTGEVGQINKVKGKIAWIKLASNKKSFFPSDIKNLKPTGKREKGKTLWTEGILTEGKETLVATGKDKKGNKIQMYKTVRWGGMVTHILKSNGMRGGLEHVH